MQCAPLREKPSCHHLISWRMTQPTVSEKCKQVSKEQVRLHPEDLHVEIQISLLRFAGVCACVRVCISQSVKGSETE